MHNRGIREPFQVHTDTVYNLALRGLDELTRKKLRFVVLVEKEYLFRVTERPFILRAYERANYFPFQRIVDKHVACALNHRKNLFHSRFFRRRRTENIRFKHKRKHHVRLNLSYNAYVFFLQ